ncbi:MAG: hypothetical protein ABSE35_08480 [Bryobacteraceae bacterium]|jgi:nitrogen fixation-related uncharacterized protein
MSFLSIAFLVFSAAVLGIVLTIGLVALFRVRSGQWEDLQMKRHVQRLAVANSDAAKDRPFRASRGTRLTG